MTGFDLIVVGAGPAGVSAAVMASSLRMRTVVVEAEQVGAKLRSIDALQKRLASTSPLGGQTHRR
ncbi:FAD-binding protein [Streptomyces sp. NRRL B-1347]|uniref:FAD-binding protein n=1 Tax=Streptomyces sp. NRRL B-1347 TaxID=1476877 RepID=UPI0004CBD3AA|nr:FAD-binding protein [Streptomyces sp. NRRL B-1347]